MLLNIHAANAHSGNVTLGRFILDYSFNPDIKYTDLLGNLLTFFTIFIAGLALLISWHQYRQMQEKEYAERIRNSATISLAKIKKRQKIRYRFFLGLSPLFMDVANILKNKKTKKEESKLIFKILDVSGKENKKFEVIKNSENARNENHIQLAIDFISKNLAIEREKCYQELIAEDIELVWRDIFGYDRKLDDTLNKILDEIDEIEFNIEKITSDFLQENVKMFKYKGNMNHVDQLNKTTSMIAYLYKKLMSDILVIFETEITKVILAGNHEIYMKAVNIEAPLRIPISNARNGLICLSNKNFQKSIYYFEEAIKNDNNYESGFWAGKGLALQAQKNDVLADEAFDQASKLMESDDTGKKHDKKMKFDLKLLYSHP